MEKQKRDDKSAFLKEKRIKKPNQQDKAKKKSKRRRFFFRPSKNMLIQDQGEQTDSCVMYGIKPGGNQVDATSCNSTDEDEGSDEFEEPASNHTIGRNL